jgi:hypothetical protein
MLKRAKPTAPIGKRPKPQIRVTHSFPDPRPDDPERFLGLVRRLVEMARKKK